LVLHIGRKLNVTKAINDLSSTKHEREGRVGDGGGVIYEKASHVYFSRYSRVLRFSMFVGYTFRRKSGP